METAMTKSKTIAVALAALTLAVTMAATGGQAQAKGWGKGVGFGVGIAAGALIAGAAASSYYGGPAYVAEPDYRECRYVQRVNAYGYVRTVRVCDVVPY
jgi:hypothetical protein